MTNSARIIVHPAVPQYTATQPVTTAVKAVLKSLGIAHGKWTYSDPRTPANLKPGYQAVGVKLYDCQPDGDQQKQVISEMIRKGYDFHYITSASWGKATRFCFSKPA